MLKPLLVLQITFTNEAGCFDLDVTTFQMAVLFAWNQRPLDHITYENLRLATELPDPELKRTLWVSPCPGICLILNNKKTAVSCF